MRELEDKFEIEKFPTKGDITKTYLKERMKETGNLPPKDGMIQKEEFNYPWIYKRLSGYHSALLLLYVVFAAVLVLSILAILSYIELTEKIHWEQMLGQFTKEDKRAFLQV